MVGVACSQSLAATGEISSTPTAAGTGIFTVRVGDNTAQRAENVR
jgi:hypothetical protein